MRLGQLARKYDISQQEIISYLNEIEPTSEGFHSNSKLSEKTEALVAKAFKISLDESPELQVELNEKADEEVAEESIESIEPLAAIIEEQVELSDDQYDLLLPESEYTPLPERVLGDSQQEVEVPEALENQETVIESDRLLELLDSEEASVDLSKITRIKAPKKELSGLKVVGKIELPESKIKIDEKVQGNGKIVDGKDRNERRHQNDEEREKRRLQVKKQKEEYDAHQEKQRKEKIEKQRKALKEAHYRQKFQPTQDNQSKGKDKPQPPEIIAEIVEQRLQSKTLLGKFWRWMNP